MDFLTNLIAIIILNMMTKGYNIFGLARFRRKIEIMKEKKMAVND